MPAAASGSNVVLGIDLGGTKIAAGLVDPDSGAVLHRMQIATEPERGAADILNRVSEMRTGLLGKAASVGLRCAGVGFGVCEIVDREGRIRSASLADWRAADLAGLLGAGLPVVVVADVRAAALAELHFGAARGVRDGLYVSIGTGISVSLICGGAPYAGAHGAALVLGSAPVETACDACGKVRSESLEDFAAGLGIERSYDHRRATPAHLIVARAEAGEERAKTVILRAARHAGAAIGQLSNCTDPEAIILGGGLGCADGLYGAELRRSLERARWIGMPEPPRILKAKLGPDSGLIGAALGLHLKGALR